MQAIRVITGFAALAMAGAAWAQSYPVKAVRIIVPHPPGSVVDIPVRGSAQAWSQALGQPFVVDNRAGAEGIIGAEACAKGAPDGYTLCGTDSLVISLNPVTRSKLPYDPRRDFTPVVQLGFLTSSVVVSPSMPVKSMEELMALARAKPGEVSWGSWGVISLSNIYIEWLRQSKGITFLNVPYKSALQSTQALLAGEIQVSLFGAGPAAIQQKAGKLRVIAVNGETRSELLPDIPSFKEAGIDMPIRTWFGLFAPAGTPADIVQRLNAIAAKSLSDRDFKAKFLTSQGLELVGTAGGTPEQFAAFLRSERATYENVVKLTGIRED